MNSTSLTAGINANVRALLQQCGITPEAGADASQLDRLLERSTERGRADRAPGAVYTERKEASFMCRLALSDWLSRRMDLEIEEVEEAILSGSVDCGMLRELEHMSMLDPACGAGAFLVEMFDLLHRVTPWTIDKISDHLYGADVDPVALRAAALRIALRTGQVVQERLWLLDSLDPAAYERKFDIVIGNPPYVRQEWITDPLANEGKAASSPLRTGRHRDVPDERDYKDRLRRWACSLFPDIRIDGRSDLCVYFFLRALSLLHPGGACCLITTGSWLDAGFGEGLRRLLANRFDLRLVIEDEVRRAFPQADVNPIITLAAAAQPTGSARFAVVRRHGAGVESQKPKLEDTPEFRLCTLDSFHKWGSLHLRASPLALESIESGLLAPLGSHPLVKMVGRGVRTGLDAFFCLRSNRVEELGIEPEFLLPLVKSPLQFVNRPPVAPAEPDWYLFVCPSDLGMIPSRSSAMRYVRKAERQHGRVGERWWSLEPGQPADILLPIGFGERLFAVANPNLAAAHQRFATLYPSDGAVDLLRGLLRCSITLYFVELFGRRTLGQGALDIPPVDWRMVYVPKVANGKGSDIIEAAAPVYARPCLTVREEMEREDQLRLDSAVAAALGLDEAVMASVRVELVDLVARRLARPQGVAG